MKKSLFNTIFLLLFITIISSCTLNYKVPIIVNEKKPIVLSLKQKLLLDYCYDLTVLIIPILLNDRYEKGILNKRECKEVHTKLVLKENMNKYKAYIIEKSNYLLDDDVRHLLKSQLTKNSEQFIKNYSLYLKEFIDYYVGEVNKKKDNI